MITKSFATQSQFMRYEDDVGKAMKVQKALSKLSTNGIPPGNGNGLGERVLALVVPQVVPESEMLGPERYREY